MVFIWTIAGHELGTLSIRLHNSLTAYDNLWALKFDNFSEFLNIISESPSPTPSVIMMLCVRKSICDSPLSKTYLSIVSLNQRELESNLWSKEQFKKKLSFTW